MVTLDVWNSDRHEIAAIELAFQNASTPTVLHLRTVPGATALEVFLADDKHPVLWAEIDCDPGGDAELRIQRRGADWHVTSPAGHVIRLDPKLHRREAPIVVPDVQALDVAFLIDGTARDYEAEGAGRVHRLVPDSKAWRRVAFECAEFAATLANGGPIRWAVLAYGDHTAAGISRPDLRGAYVVLPEKRQRQFVSGIDSLLDDGLLKIPSSSGGDFVDALADGLFAVAELPWSSARKVLVVIGDSPGYEVLRPPPRLANAHARELEVQSEVYRLHRKGIATVTVLHDLGMTADHFRSSDSATFLSYTEGQYQRVACERRYAWRSSQFQGAVAAHALRTGPRVLARGPFPGVIIDAQS